MSGRSQRVAVKRPAEGNKSSYGQAQGQDAAIYDKWDCSIEEVAGGESDVANQSESTTTFIVKGYTDPKKPIQATDYLEWNDGYSATPRILHVADAGGQPGLTASLTCGELK
jgi:hypothetical protein